MTMPASGCIALITCPNGVACTSIGVSVSGNATPPKSLCELSTTAGKLTPHAMTEFYSFGWKSVSFCTVSTTGCGTAATACTRLCVLNSCALVSGECYCLCLAGDISTVGQGLSSSGYYQVMCNGSQVYCCGVGANTCVSSITYSMMVTSTVTTLHVVNSVTTTSTACTGCSMINGSINCIQQISGSFCRSNPFNSTMITG